MDPELRAATLAAGNIQAPESSLGASNAPELAKLFQSTFQVPLAAAATGAAGSLAAEKVKQDEENAKMKAKMEADLADISAYKIVKKGDGGYDFFEPGTGKQVDIATLAKRTGANPADIIKDSENPIDIQFREDYNNLQDYINAISSGDRKKAEAYRKARPELSQYDDRGGVQRLLDDFKNHYKRFYVTRDIDPKAWGVAPGGVMVPHFASDASQFDTSGYSLTPGG